ncbi:kinase [Phenylobacterium sp.]|uniref:kinase n=1 Tax=Phenylobacterium sp. TaxID=1871053 RepID=UPI0027371585|nr:kinase [Phenylobacterium sp.]MDP3854121.1 kinase [Phenylobacterium sp.]
MSDWLERFVAAESLPPDFSNVARAICAPLAGQVAARAAATPGLVVGVCGAQASGKSTLTAVTRRLLEDRGLKVALFSLDDLYLTHDERQALARDVHPLLATRGVPGTHDVALGLALIEALKRPGEIALPAFDKARDDRRPRADWPRFEGPAEVILFEGWCVGARPQGAEALAEPLNDLERTRDPDGTWRGFANAALAGPYRDLFSRIDLQVLLRAPGFEVVLEWRREQERKLRARLAREGADTSRTMSDAQVTDFIAHYERLTRWILEEMPGRADLVIGLDAARRPI